MKNNLINYLNNVKSVYIFKKIFNNILKDKWLGIVRYNKTIQKKLNLNINDYKEYSQLYSSIELEIKLIHNSDRFINISKTDKSFYHIYFDGEKEEFKESIFYNEDKCECHLIKIKIDYQVVSFESLFADCKDIESLCFKKFTRININNMKCMFKGCSSLKELNLDKFVTNNVTDMSEMFSGCKSLKTLDLSNFNTNNVTIMNEMFFKCSSLEELNISNFNIDNVTYMEDMFAGCLNILRRKLINKIKILS